MKASADKDHPWYDPTMDLTELRCYVRGRHVLAISASEEDGMVECPLRGLDGRITPRAGPMLLIRSTYSEPGIVKLMRDDLRPCFEATTPELIDELFHRGWIAFEQSRVVRVRAQRFVDACIRASARDGAMDHIRSALGVSLGREIIGHLELQERQDSNSHSVEFRTECLVVVA